MKIAIVGPGALGCLLAARLFAAGEDVCLVDYRPDRVRLLSQQGIRLEASPGRETVMRIPIGLAGDITARDLAIVTVKTYRTAAAALALPRLLAPGGIALTLQNGLGNLEEMAKVVGWEPLAAGVTYLGVIRRDEGVVVPAGQGPTFLGAPQGSRVTRPTLEEVAQRFGRAGLECGVRADIEALLCEKLQVNVAINPLTAILRVPNGMLLDLPEAWQVSLAAAREAAAVAQAAGFTLPEPLEDRLRRVCTATAANRSSMLQDILAGRPTEIEALNGQVAARGAALSVPTPTNDLLTKLVRSLEQSVPRRVG